MAGPDSQQVKRLKDLIGQYLDDGQLAKLDILSQLFDILKDESYIIANIRERCEAHIYEGDSQSLYANVEQDLAKIVPLDQRNTLGDYAKQFIKLRGLETMCRHVKHAVELAPPEQKEIVGAFLRLYDLSGKDLAGAIELPSFFHSCKAAYHVKEEAAEKWLVGLGLINGWHYHSKSMSHAAWDIPEWSRVAMMEMSRFPQAFRIPFFSPDNLLATLVRPEAKALLAWLMQGISGQHGIIENQEWEVGKREYETRFGIGAFDEEVGRLTWAGATAIGSTTGAHMHGHLVYLNPEAVILL